MHAWSEEKFVSSVSYTRKITPRLKALFSVIYIHFIHIYHNGELTPSLTQVCNVKTSLLSHAAFPLSRWKLTSFTHQQLHHLVFSWWRRQIVRSNFHKINYVDFACVLFSSSSYCCAPKYAASALPSGHLRSAAMLLLLSSIMKSSLLFSSWMGLLSVFIHSTQQYNCHRFLYTIPLRCSRRDSLNR